MATVSIRNKGIFKIDEELENEVFYGSNQDWYLKKWQRMAGCGPSTVTNMIYYLNRSKNLDTESPQVSKAEILELMNEVWKYVTPGIFGVSSTRMLQNGVQKYLKVKNMNLKMNLLDIPKRKDLRPEIQKVLTFLTHALEKDTPVAFLNLEHGSISELESWHWVTIITLDYEPGSNEAFVHILDSGTEKRISLSQWLQTTKMGGGFVSFYYV